MSAQSCGPDLLPSPHSPLSCLPQKRRSRRGGVKRRGGANRKAGVLSLENLPVPPPGTDLLPSSHPLLSCLPQKRRCAWEPTSTRAAKIRQLGPSTAIVANRVSPLELVACSQAAARGRATFVSDSPLPPGTSTRTLKPNRPRTPTTSSTTSSASSSTEYSLAASSLSSRAPARPGRPPGRPPGR